LAPDARTPGARRVVDAARAAGTGIAAAVAAAAAIGERLSG
jgi:hypothetical protein